MNQTRKAIIYQISLTGVPDNGIHYGQAQVDEEGETWCLGGVNYTHNMTVR